MTKQVDNERRNFVTKASYAAPAIVTLAAMPAMANTGSARGGDNGGGGGRRRRRRRRRRRG